MPYEPIENYGVVGNMRTVALVGMNGSIDWYCYPNFDSPSVFGALLDDRKGGRFQISTLDGNTRRKQFYWPSTNILVTRFLSPDGVLEIEDYMPVGVDPDSPWLHRLCRRVRCVRGAVRTRISCRPAFDYGRAKHELRLMKGGADFQSPDLGLALSTALPLQPDHEGGVVAEVTLEEGQSQVLVLGSTLDIEHGECGRSPLPDEAEELFQRTVKFWHTWLSASTYRGRWREQVHRSALALKLLTFEPTGALIAAPTTSLPESIGGSRNWDYRYGWLRDAAFTIYAFVRLGFRAEAEGFVQWLQKHVARNVDRRAPTPAMFTIHGDVRLPEQEISHWEGYRGSRPVRIGNAAATQFQNDIAGDLMDTVYLYNKHVMQVDYDTWSAIRDVLNTVCENWSLPDNGLWEMRGRREHFVHSKVMNWVALDRGIRLADKRSFPGDRERWLRVRDEIYEEILRRGWNEARGAFTLYYGSNRRRVGAQARVIGPEQPVTFETPHTSSYRASRFSALHAT